MRPHATWGRGANATVGIVLALVLVVPLPGLPALRPAGSGFPHNGIAPAGSKAQEVSARPYAPSNVCTWGLNGTCPHVVPAISAYPRTVCREGSPSCPGGAPFDTRATLWANSSGHMVMSPPNVQVLFVVETTLFDGVYDPLAGEPGKSSCNGPCSESNAVPFFVANAGTISQDIASRYPGSQVGFGLVDYFSTQGADHDDGDGLEYHVDTTGFVSASTFPTQVVNTFQANVLSGGWVYGDSDFSDNILSSSSLTALYGAATGVGYGWNATDAKVIVWMGSTVPRDPNYVSDYSPTDSNFNAGMSSSCEPPYFGGQPNCYGWAGASNSVGAYAKANKIVVDTIDLATGMTLLNSGDYLSTGANAQADVKNVLQAGCDMAMATGGSWEGPSGFTCPAAATGTGQGNLTCVSGGSCEARGAEYNPARAWSTNLALGWALTNINFPSVRSNVSATGANRTAFQYYPPSGFVIDPVNPGYTSVSCFRSSSNPPLPGPCSPKPSYTGLGPLGTGVAWSWPDPTMYLNDSWGVSFNLVAVSNFSRALLGTYMPADACANQSWWSGCRPLGKVYSSLGVLSSSGAPLSPAPSYPPEWVDVVAPPALAARASANPMNGTAPLAVQFNGVAVGGTPPFTYLWDFGDGSLGSRASAPVHSYNTSGVFLGRLTLSDASGYVAYARLNLSVSPTPPLLASASANQTAGEVALPVSFTGTASGGVPPYVWYWDFGDGSFSRIQDPAHVYSNAGTFLVVLTVNDSFGQSAQRFLDINATPGPLRTSASAVPLSGPEPLTVSFNSTPTGGAPPFTISWSFGDGSSGSGLRDPAHVFNSTGTYQVRVLVLDKVYQAASAKLWINVTPGPPSLTTGLTADPNPVSVGKPTLLQVSPQGGTSPYSYRWVGTPTGEGCASSSIPDLNCTPSSAGNFTVEVFVTDSKGSVAHATVLLVVHPVGSPQPGGSGMDLLGAPVVDLFLLAFAVAFILAATLWVMLVHRRRRSSATQASFQPPPPPPPECAVWAEPSAPPSPTDTSPAELPDVRPEGPPSPPPPSPQREPAPLTDLPPVNPPSVG